MKSVYLGFNDKQDVEVNFSVELNKDVKILVASYYTGDYEGSSFVLFEENGKLFEVNGSHCSCYGLEGQWSPEEVSIEELKHRIEHGNLALYMGCYTDEILAVAAKVSKMRKFHRKKEDLKQ